MFMPVNYIGENSVTEDVSFFLSRASVCFLKTMQFVDILCWSRGIFLRSDERLSGKSNFCS